MGRRWQRSFLGRRLNRPHVQRLQSCDIAQQSSIVGAAIAVSELPDQHSAIFWKPASGRPRCLEYTRKIVASIADDENLVWAPIPRLTDFEFRQLRALCDLIYNAEPKPLVPYRFRASRESMFIPDVRGVRFLAGAGVTGLTCATFILAILNQLENYRLIMLDEWPPANVEDILARRMIVNLFIQARRFSDVAELNAEINSPRPTPAQIGGACLFRYVPVGFWQAENASSLVRRYLVEYYSRNGISQPTI
jgi:hypothetical protein